MHAGSGDCINGPIARYSVDENRICLVSAIEMTITNNFRLKYP